MPRRKNEDDFERLLKKFKKLEKKVRRRCRSRSRSSSRSRTSDTRYRLESQEQDITSDSEARKTVESNVAMLLDERGALEPEGCARGGAEPLHELASIEAEARTPVSSTEHTAATATVTAAISTAEPSTSAILTENLTYTSSCENLESADATLDSTILEILGEDPTVTNTYGTEIHKDLAVRLEHITIHGLSKELRKELNEKYLLPSNCKLINGPTLNAEIKAAISEITVKRDKSIELRQKQTATAISCLSQAINKLFSSKNADPELIRMLMDAERILCDTQHNDSTIRRNFILSSLKKDMKDQLQNTKTDSLLFGQVRLLRSAGLISTNYLDDYWLMGQSYGQCLYNTIQTKRLLTSLGFLINEEKSSCIPNKRCIFLGFVLDSEKFQVTLPTEKIDRVKLKIQKFLTLNRCKVREFARFIGLLISICPAVEYSWLYTKIFERVKYLNLRPDDNYDKHMNLPVTLLPDLRWWHNAIQRPFNRIREDTHDLEIFSDASTTGWGAACGKGTASGLWSAQERSQHINYLEILAAFFGLRVFAKELNNCQILLRIDNTTAISYINRMGGIQFPHLTNITRELWQWCECRKVHVMASYIRSSDNKTADEESRRVHPDIEWELADWAYQEIISTFGTPEVDLFASRINKKCTKYISWHRDPDAVTIDAFTISWADYRFYAFPPFSVILKTLRKVISDKATGIVVVPLWPTQPWYPLYKSLLLSDPIHFNANKNPIMSFHSSSRNIHNKLTLVAGLLCGRRG